MRAPLELTDPVKAKQIALHTEGVLEQIRACEHLPQLDKIHQGYAAFSKTMGVVKPIRDHVQDAFNETATTIKARLKNKERVVRDPTGEANPDA